MVKQASALNWLTRGLRSMRGTRSVPIGRTLDPDLGEMALRQPKLDWVPRFFRSKPTLPITDGGDAVFRPRARSNGGLPLGGRPGSL